jgi:16S rRNA (guanine527-N7)-methyltransferase
VEPDDFRARLTRRAAGAAVALSQPLTASLSAYYDLLQRWNRTINLTALTTEDEAIDRLLLEPLLAARHLPSPPLRLLDIGSGGGSPAIPIKLAVPSLALTMVEGRSRKAAFLREAIRILQLSDTAVEASRLEEISDRREWQSAWDAVSSRGVRIGQAELAIVSRLLRPGGLLILFLPTTAFPADLASSAFGDPQVEPLLPAASSFLAILRRKSDVDVPRGTLA